MIFNLPENPVELVCGHLLLRRLADADLSPDPSKIKEIIKNISRTSSKKKLAELHRIIA